MSWFSRIFEGALAPWDGYQYMRKNPKLWRYGVWPTIINAFVTIGGLILLINLSVNWGGEVGGEGWWGSILRFLSIVGLILLSFLSVIALWMILNAALCSFFYGKLAMAVEISLGKRPEDLKEISIPAQIVDAFRAIGKLAVINVGLLFLNILPVIGSGLSAFLGYYFNAKIFGTEFFEYPLELRGLRRSEKLKLLENYRPEVLGFGGVILILNFIPILGSLILTTSVVGAGLTIHRFESKPS